MHESSAQEGQTEVCVFYVSAVSGSSVANKITFKGNRAVCVSDAGSQFR